MTNEELWQAVLAQIQLNISQANFATWFRGTEISNIKEGTVFVSVPNSFSKEWMENKYNKPIFKTIHELNKEIKEIKYNVEKKLSPSQDIIAKAPSIAADADQMDFQEFKINKDTNLNPRYTFDSFVTGSFNELPHAAAIAVSKNPGSVYNPLFIYGGVGLGKTHLLQSIGNEVIKNFKKKTVRYVSSEKFTSEVVASIKNHEVEAFKEKYRKIDVLIIDDIQFLAGREKTQEEFFNIFNVLYENNKQIIISSDRPPKAINSLAERLRSRFEGGMIADISYPDFETRVAILKTKSQEKGVEFSDEIYQHIASVVQKNIRELEGALNKLIANQTLNNQKPDLETTKIIIKDLLSSPSRVMTPKKIIEAVAEFYDLKEKEILNVSRKKEIVHPRQIAMYLLREELKHSYPFIGRKFQGKDHTTAIHSCGKISKELEKNERLGEEINLIKQRLFNS